MRQATCKELRGVCDQVITGETPEIMAENGKSHVMDMLSDGDKAHQGAVASMQSLSREDQEKWYENFKNSFDSLPDA